MKLLNYATLLEASETEYYSIMPMGTILAIREPSYTPNPTVPELPFVKISDVTGPARSPRPSQARPKKAGPSRAFDVGFGGLGLGLAFSKASSLRPKPIKPEYKKLTK